MNDNIPLAQDGTLEIRERSMIIKDKKMRWSYRLMHFSAIIWLPLSFFVVYENGFNLNSWDVKLYGISFLVHLFVLILSLRFSIQETVRFDEVEKAKVKTGINNANLILYLKNGKRRRVHAEKTSASRLRTFAAANLPQ